MNYANLIQNITENIKTNGSQAITAQVLQDVLVDMVGELGQSGALLGGVIDTSFVPDSTNDAQVVYIAESPGTYTNFNGLVVGAGEVAFFYFDGNAWAKSSVDVLEVVNDLNSTATDKALSAAMGKQLQDSLTQAVQDLTTAIGDKADRQTTEQALNTLQSQINDKADTTYVNSQLATKADTATVNAALALKADTSAVNAALATKADTSALATKADKVVGAVAGNMASLDASGNLVDSGINSSAVGDVANKIDRVVGAEVGNVAAFDAIGGIEDSGVAADNIAEQDGYYETMVVGSAENLIGSDIVASQFIRRKTGGSTDVGTGVAILKTIRGNTLVWNQLVPNGNFGNGTTGWSATGGTIAASAGVGTYTYTTAPVYSYTNRLLYNGINSVNGHKYLCMFSVKPTKAVRVRFSLYTNSTPETMTPNAWNRYAQIITNGGAETYLGIWLDTSLVGAVSDEILIRDIVLIDLTLMFGAGNEPATAAEFEAMFPLNYYAYNTGSLLNLTATGLQTNGFNQWDEEWEGGGLNSTTGATTSDGNRIRSKNFVPVFPSTAYYIKAPMTGLDLFEYDADKNYIGYTASVGNSARTTTAQTHYIKFRIGSSGTPVTTYGNNICINLSDVNKNGTYEPYWSETKALPITTATSGGVAIFPDGMRSAGTAYDEMTATKATKRIGVVDLGTLNWTYDTSLATPVFSTPWANIPGAFRTANLRCAIYTYKANFWGDANSYGFMAMGSSNLNVSNSSYTDAATFKTAMSGVYLYYELATPTDYTLDTPFNGQYKVDNDGTETILPENTSTPTTSPIVADINYALNAIDTIRNLPQNYISKASMDAILTAFKTAGVITNYTLTWDATNQKYNCTITA